MTLSDSLENIIHQLKVPSQIFPEYQLWEKLSSGGEKSQCGWLKDKFGISWQVLPSILMKLLNDTDPEKSKRVMNAMLKMNKILIKDLEKAYNKQ